MTLQAFLESQGISLTKEEVNKIFKECYDEAFRLGIMPKMYPEVPRALERLSKKGITLAMVSAHPVQNLKRETQMYNIRNYFLLMLGWATAHKTKSILEVCSRLAILPENTIYIGDMVMDIRSAKEAGVHSVAIARANEESYHSEEILEKENPEVLIKTLDEIFEGLGVHV